MTFRLFPELRSICVNLLHYIGVCLRIYILYTHTYTFADKHFIYLYYLRDKLFAIEFFLREVLCK